jgi:hypothetical protein
LGLTPAQNPRNTGHGRLAPYHGFLIELIHQDPDITLTQGIDPIAILVRKWSAETRHLPRNVFRHELRGQRYRTSTDQDKPFMDKQSSRPDYPHNQRCHGETTGYKNWMFAGSEGGGKAMAVAFTLIETAKLTVSIPKPKASGF